LSLHRLSIAQHDLERHPRAPDADAINQNRERFAPTAELGPVRRSDRIDKERPGKAGSQRSPSRASSVRDGSRGQVQSSWRCIGDRLEGRTSNSAVETRARGVKLVRHPHQAQTRSVRRGYNPCARVGRGSTPDLPLARLRGATAPLATSRAASSRSYPRSRSACSAHPSAS